MSGYPGSRFQNRVESGHFDMGIMPISEILIEKSTSKHESEPLGDLIS